MPGPSVQPVPPRAPAPPGSPGPPPARALLAGARRLAPPAGGVLAKQVVPRTTRAHLDVETHDRVRAPAQPLELGRRPRAPAARRETRAEHVGHLDGPLVLADGAVVPERLPDVACRPQQLWVRVAHVVEQHLALAHVAHERVAHY